MTPTPTMHTSPTQMDGTIAGMIIIAIVAVLGLMILIAMVFWAANHPGIKPAKGSHPMRQFHAAYSADPYSVAPNSHEPVNSSDDSRPGGTSQTTYDVVEAGSNAQQQQGKAHP